MALAAGLLVMGFAGTLQAQVCVGDCDAGGAVTVDELLGGVSIALGTKALDTCPDFDTDDSGAVEVTEVVAAVNAALAGCPATPTPSPTATQLPLATPIFPASYRNTYVEVRNCRFSAEHGGVSIRVLANPIGADAYLEEQNPLPLGSIIVKEEYNDSVCTDDSKLVRWRAMRKEPPGFDADFGDWHWQWVNRDRKVQFDDKSTCIGCHLAPACVARDYQCTHAGNPTLPPTLVVFDGLPPALLAVAGTSATNVFVVGADPHDGLGPYVLHYNGQCWKRLRTGATGGLWWISFKPIDGAFYMVGEGGLILRYDLASGEFERQTGPGNEILFGVWGETASSIWAVGGSANNPSTGGIIWHYDGQSWQTVNLSHIFPGGAPRLFKIWGRNESDIYAVGQAGTILHYDGESWSKVVSATSRPLFTVHGNDNVVIATGGFADGVIVENAGDGFVDRTPRLIQQVNGVFAPPTSGAAVAVGINASFALRDTNGWTIAQTDLDTRRDFHAVWLDPEGGAWAVGGDLSVNLRDGLLVYAGSRAIPSELDLEGTGSACSAGVPPQP